MAVDRKKTVPGWSTWSTALVVCALAGACSLPEDQAEASASASPAEASPATEPAPPASSQTPNTAVAVPPGFFDAAMNGQVTAVCSTVDAGVPVDTTNDQGTSALMLAAFNGHDDLVRELLTRGAYIDKSDGLGRTALMYASSGPYGNTVRILIEHGADPNHTENNEGWTALMFAAGEGQVGVIRELLSGGADPTVTDTDGDVAADHAQRNGHQGAVQLLEQAIPES